MERFFSPASTIVPDYEGEEVWIDGVGIIRRRWDVSLFDWAELATKHKVRIPWTIADHLLKSCNLEISIQAPAFSEAARMLKTFHVMLYINGLHPFTTQMISDYSINQYAGINFRKSKHGTELLPEDLREGVSSETATVNIWRTPYTSAVWIMKDTLDRRLTEDLLNRAVDDMHRWVRAREKNPICSLLEDVALTAPAMPLEEQSILHIWTGLEAIFPNVQTEISFRIALYLAQMQAGDGNRLAFFERARKSYQDRSKIAHGGKLKISKPYDPWIAAWSLLMETMQAIAKREEIPKEENLIRELLES